MKSLKERKLEFLKKLKSKSGYKRYLGSPIRYPGGKSQAVGYIVELLPDNIDLVVSPFIGGGSVEIALAKELGIKVIAFDIFDILVNFWQIILNKTTKEKLVNNLYKFKPNEKTFKEVKDTLTKHWRFVQYNEGSKDNLIEDKVELATLYFFNYQLSYGPGFLGWSSKVYLNEKSYSKILKKLEEFEVNNLEVHQADFREVLPRYKDRFLYLDPPYYIGPDSKMFKGIYPQRNFPIHHNNFPHETLRDMLRDHKGGFILSYNDCETIRNYYKDYKFIFPKWHYSMGLGEKRIGKYRKERNQETNKKESHEILIFSL